MLKNLITSPIKRRHIGNYPLRLTLMGLERDSEEGDEEEPITGAHRTHPAPWEAEERPTPPIELSEQHQGWSFHRGNTPSLSKLKEKLPLTNRNCL